MKIQVSDQVSDATTVDTARKIDFNAGRRAFIRNMGISAAGAAVFAGAGFGATSEAEAAALTDADILNFALNLEYLEAEFYLRAAFGRSLRPADTTGVGGAPGAVLLPSGARRVNFGGNRVFQQYAEEIATDEENHVQFIRLALGGAAVSRPRIDLNSSFTAAARASGLISSSQTFNPFASINNFLLAAFIFEDVGVTAYKGAAPLLTSKAVLEAAAGLLAVEAYHAGEIRTLLIAEGLDFQANKISDARDSLDGSTDLDQGPTTGPANNRIVNVVPTDENGLAFSRTPQQVLNIVYLSPTGEEGGFFPQGVRGTIQSS